jgi:hypothetical protein
MKIKLRKKNIKLLSQDLNKLSANDIGKVKGAVCPQTVHCNNESFQTIDRIPN